jgi:hypothetical protein
VEEALLHHLQALRELPLDLVIPPRVVVAHDDGEASYARYRQVVA